MFREEKAKVNQEQVEQLAFRVIGDLGGALTMALGYIGDQLGLYTAMRGAGLLSSDDLAEKTNLNERYVREWLRAMVAAEYIDYDEASGKYLMTDEQGHVLCDEESPFFVGGAFHFATPSIYNVPRIMDAFRKGGGIPYSEIGGDIPCAIERLLKPAYINSLASTWIPTIPGLKEKLDAGARVCDVGCGRGQSRVNMALAFPKSSFVGIDYDRGSIASAMKLAVEKGVSNVEFIQAPAEQIPTDPKFDLICTFDCIHDMVDPLATLEAIREALAEDGVNLWGEPNASHNAHENRNPLGKVFHAISPLHCMTVSLAYDGAGLGTVIGEKGARELAEQAGFKHFEPIPIEDPFNQFFALRT